MSGKELTKDVAGYVVRDFNVGYTTEPERGIGLELAFDKADESGQQRMLFVIDGRDAAEIIKQFQSLLGGSAV